jgi:hypothetical protein
MFIDARYDCVTVPEVREEFIRTQKFKTKYPWRGNYTAKIQTVPKNNLENKEFELTFSTVRTLHRKGLINPNTNKLYNLSRVDQLIIAYAVANRYKLSSVDKDLVAFAKDQFETTVVPPLGIVNHWLRKGLIVWDDSLQGIIEDWSHCREQAQPPEETMKFKAQTGYRYVGP